jgi:phosphopantothenoylcysteine synthetase/decarboxylase
VFSKETAEFVRPLAFRSVTGRPVFTDMWTLDEHVRHVRLGQFDSLNLPCNAEQTSYTTTYHVRLSFSKSPYQLFQTPHHHQNPTTHYPLFTPIHRWVVY